MSRGREPEIFHSAQHAECANIPEMAVMSAVTYHIRTAALNGAATQVRNSALPIG